MDFFGRFVLDQTQIYKRKWFMKKPSKKIKGLWNFYELIIRVTRKIKICKQFWRKLNVYSQNVDSYLIWLICKPQTDCKKRTPIELGFRVEGLK